MKPWEIKRTRNKLNKMSAEKSIRLFFDLYLSARKMIRASFAKDYPHLSKKQLRLKINEFVNTVGQL